MKPDRLFSLLFGVALLITGAASLASRLILGAESWRIWPVSVLLAGAALLVPGFFAGSRRGLGGFFIPALPTLVTGGILLAASLSGRWSLWAQAWPLEILALALGFALAGAFMRLPGLALPASILAVNGAALLFCAISGAWNAWAVMWPLEFLAVGLGLMIMWTATRRQGIFIAALTLVALAGGGFFISALFVKVSLSSVRFLVPGLLLTTGAFLVGLSLLKREAPSEPKTPVSL